MEAIRFDKVRFSYEAEEKTTMEDQPFAEEASQSGGVFAFAIDSFFCDCFINLFSDF